MKGRTFEHSGFELTGLEAFCRRLESMGVTFATAYRKNADGIATSTLTDPRGTSIELAEGLRPSEDANSELFSGSGRTGEPSFVRGAS